MNSQDTQITHQLNKAIQQQATLKKRVATLEKRVAELEAELSETKYIQQEIGLLKIAELSPGYEINN